MTDDFENRLTHRLQRLAEHAPAPSHSAPFTPPMRQFRSRHRAVWAGALAVFVGVVVLAIARAGSDSTEPSGPMVSTATDARHLRDALAGDGVAIDSIAVLAALDAQRFCGTITTQTGTVSTTAATAAQTSHEAATCFLDAVLSQNVVTVVRRYVKAPTESAHQIEVIQSRPDNHFDILTIDATRPDPAPSALDCEGIIANEALNATPGPPYDPGFFKIHGCREVDAATVQPAIDNAPPPTWVLERKPLPRCGAAPWRPANSYVDRRLSPGTTDCINDAIRQHRAAEVGFTLDGDQMGVARWFRIETDRTYEAIELVDDRKGSRTWQRYRCPIPLLDSDGTPSPARLSSIGCVER